MRSAIFASGSCGDFQSVLVLPTACARAGFRQPNAPRKCPEDVNADADRLPPHLENPREHRLVRLHCPQRRPATPGTNDDRGPPEVPRSADSVRASSAAHPRRVRRGVVLIEEGMAGVCSVVTQRNALARVTVKKLAATGGLDALLMAKLRDEIGSQGVGPFDVLSGGGGHVGATSELRRFQSIFYYHFPADDLVRTGDIVVSDAGTYAMVFSPQCHLERFRKKTGGRLTLIDAEEVAPDGIAALTGSGVKLSKVGASAIASHGSAGHSVVVLPNVPKEPNGRHSLFDIAIRTHAWNSLRIEKRENGPLQYADVPSVTRLCTITDTWCAAIVSHVAGIMASAGVPDFPDFEKARIDQILSQE